MMRGRKGFGRELEGGEKSVLNDDGVGTEGFGIF
jgi:hypothetical protein